MIKKALRVLMLVWALVPLSNQTLKGMTNLQQRFENKIAYEPNTGCWLWTGSLSYKGYGRFNVDGINNSAHRVSYQLFKGSIPDGLHIIHSCDVRCCVNPDHLSVGTNYDNVQDRVSKGRSAMNKGESHPNCKLTEMSVRIIIEASLHFKRSLIASYFHVTTEQIGNIINRKSWTHL